jgi:hypothetical protein
MLFALSFPAEAQEPAKIRRVGVLGGSLASANAPRMQAFRQGLHDLGHVEGKNIAIEQRWAEGCPYAAKHGMPTRPLCNLLWQGCEQCKGGPS